MDPRHTPEKVPTGHPCDQLANFTGNPRAPRFPKRSLRRPRTVASGVCNCKQREGGILVLPHRGRGSSLPAAFAATRAREVRVAGSVLLGDRFFEGPFVPNSSGQAQSLARDHDQAGEGPER